ncbi:phage adsorption protein NrfB [Laribacter hongkongensis]|uniref:cyclic di-3',5'-guanylate-activated glycosyltransferase NfrB n=1 Tax=Laribacter hongkongensis TaxID=168471 RepID=UPI001EFDD961|nr:cyclic di-3',5'-guanylate-activated glycosyltransferase NrfB [Laribacter hongkongensis]MCG9063690.1 phage adsorption protein NrfB [Laribacter hongkongensis]
MSLVDVLAVYLLGLKYLVLVIAVLLLLFGLDDLFIDAVFWLRRGWRRLTVYRRQERARPPLLYRQDEQPLAIMVPAWQEADVIAHMADLAARTLDYENYHIFIGTYPNDAATQEQVDWVCARHPNVHKVVCALPGPTSKADCLNNIVSSILAFEGRARIRFAGFILHDSEDVISPLELRLFNHLVARKDLIQLPVYPLPGHWYQFTRSHYLDEFAETHGKDVIVREALIGQVPSAGVGTCFSRRAIQLLQEEGDGVVFDTKSLTEDYDIGFRLAAHGLHGAFVRFEDLPAAMQGHDGHSVRNAQIGVREYFPDRLSLAVRQKARWVVGIVFQGMKNLRWSRRPLVNYFLWRDRRGALTNLVSFAAFAVLLQLAGMQLVYLAWPDAWHFPALIATGSLLWYLLLVNGLLFLLRMGSRGYFVWHSYGPVQALLSVPRTVWGMLINFLAQIRAMRQILAIGNVNRVAWDKTRHDFPGVDDANRGPPLGERLLAAGALSSDTLTAALEAAPAQHMRLGYYLVRQGLVSPMSLATALAGQAGVTSRDVDAWQLPPGLIGQLPARFALKYAVLPVEESADSLLLARESPMPPVLLAALSRRLGRPLAYCICPPGQVTVGLRHWYARHRNDADPRVRLSEAIERGDVRPEQAGKLWQQYVSRQSVLGDFLLRFNLIEAAVLNQALIAYEKSDLPFGRFLVEAGVLDQAGLDQALALQRAEQIDIDSLLDQGDALTSAGTPR